MYIEDLGEEIVVLGCPFCGSEDICITTAETSEPLHAAHCNHCNFTLFNGDIGLGWNSSVKEALTKWNTRATVIR